MKYAALLLLPLVATNAIAQRGVNQRPAGPGLAFQLLGPSGGGRVASITGVPGDARTWYLGAASGGVWKSVDEGNTFVPVFDRQTAQAIGALAIAPSDPNQVWAGTGEAWTIRDADVMGDGIYKSTDAGATWTNMGLPESGRIGRIIVHPTDPNIVFACVLGRATGEQEEHGVYRTTDGGKTWTRSLGLGGNYGCSGLTMDAKDPNTLFAGMWHVIMHTWVMYSSTHDPKNGVWVTHDGGATWKQVLDTGLPKPPLGKIDVAVAPTDSKRVYALIQTADQGSVWRSDDGGVKWRAVNYQRALIGRAGYYINIKVSPGDANEVLIASSSFFRSTDGGVTFNTVPWGGDNHDIWWDPTNPDHIGLTDDGGARVTTTHGRTFTSISLPIAQAYHVSTDNRTPYWVYTNRQDNGTMRGPSEGTETPPATGGRAEFPGFGGGRGAFAPPPDSAVTLPAAVDSAAARAAGLARGRGAGGGGGGRGGRGGRGGAAFNTWDHNLGGCESGFTIPDPTDWNIVWATCYGNKVTRYDARVNEARNVEPWFQTLDSPPNDAKYRCHWTAPLALDPFDHAVYYGCQVIFKTINNGQSWTVISPDLSTGDKSRIVSSGGVVGDNLGQFYGEVVFSIAPSPIQKGLIWAGTNDGQIWYTQDGGTKWNNVTKNVTGMPVWGTVREISPGNFDPGTAYVAVDYHIMDNRDPFIYKTTDFGKTWTRISDALPAHHPLAYVQSVAENPNRKGMVFAGTGNAFYYSTDDGAHWTQLQDGLPQSQTSWIVVPKAWHDVIVSTYGRGIYALHDITTLEQADKIPADAAAYLYQPRAGYRQARSGRAELNFMLKTAPADSVKVEILDAANSVVRTMNVAGRAGLNRATWDLHYDAPLRVELRTTPPDNAHIWDEPRFKGRDTRPITHWGIEGAIGTGPIGTPGHYTVRLSAAGLVLTQPLEIIKDPTIASSDADLALSTAMQVKIRNDMTQTATIVNKIEVMRRSLEDLLKADSTPADTKAAVSAMNQKMLDVELQLLSRTDLHSDDKWFVEKYKVYMNLIWFNGQVGTGAGDVAGGADYRPTDTQVQVLTEIEKDLLAAKAAFDALMAKDIPEFNRRMAQKVKPIS